MCNLSDQGFRAAPASSSSTVEMESLPKMHPSHLSLNHSRSSFPTPISSLSFRSLPPPPFSSSSSIQLSSITIRASSSPSPSPSPKHHAFNKPTNTVTHLLTPLVGPTCIAIAATAFFFMRLHLKPVLAAPLAPPTVDPTAENLPNEENDSVIGEQLISNPNDTEALRSLVEAKIRARKIDEAIRVIDRLIELEPDELEWPLLKAHMYSYNGDHELAMNGFEDVLKKDPFRVEAFHGLAMAASELNKPTEDLLKRVEEAMKFCKKEKRDSEVRDFKLLVAQIKVMEGNFSDALKVYQELVKEEPRDFRPYLCQGIIYTMLRKKDEAEKQFEKFRRLVPKNHPYKEYFEDNTKIFSQKLERQGRTGAKS